MLAERTPASCSLMTRRPPGSWVSRTREVTWPPPSLTVWRVRVVPARPADSFWERDDRPAEPCWPVVAVMSSVTQ
jgi:hypothetical protein